VIINFLKKFGDFYHLKCCQIAQNAPAPRNFANSSLHLFDVQKSPRRVEQLLVGTVKPEANFAEHASVGGDPVRFLARRCFWPKVDIDRAIRVLFDIWILGGTAKPIDFANERVSGTVVDYDRPVLMDGWVRGNGQAITVATFEKLALFVLDCKHVVLAASKFLDTAEYVVEGKPSVIEDIHILLLVESAPSLVESFHLNCCLLRTLEVGFEPRFETRDKPVLGLDCG